MRNSAQRDTDLSETIKIFHIKAGLSTQLQEPSAERSPNPLGPCNTKVISGSQYLSPSITDLYLNLTKWMSKSDLPKDSRRLWVLTQQQSEQISCRTTAIYRPIDTRSWVLPAHCHVALLCVKRVAHGLAGWHTMLKSSEFHHRDSHSSQAPPAEVSLLASEAAVFEPWVTWPLPDP